MLIPQQVANKHPDPHEQYLVKRRGYRFVATPCYGMHHPWWVPMTSDRELEPIDMEDTDLWIAVRSICSII